VTQRLAVGTVEGVVLIYDLRTATKWRILQGHEGAVSALAFSASGDQVVSVSVPDRTLRWWQAGSTGLFSFLGLQGSCQHIIHLDLPPAAEVVQICVEWTSSSSVGVSCNKKSLGIFSQE